MGAVLLPGVVVGGRYRLDRILGVGGMGTVWAATHTVTQKPVALKFLRADQAMDTKFRQRFLREARAACAVRHPNVVAIHDVLETDDGVPLMVMDLLEGESLAQRLSRQKVLTLEEVARVMLPVISAVGTAHALGIVHRDLKPDNVFLVREPDGREEVRVLDFGIAKLTALEGLAATTSALTVDGGLLGTPCYMSPEQADGEKDIDLRSDVWSLGIMMYECLSGRLPTQGDNVGQVLKAITRGTIRPLSEIRPDLPAAITTIVRTMTSRDRALRPASLREVAAALSPYADVKVIAFGDPVSHGVSQSPASPSASGNVRVIAKDAISATGRLLGDAETLASGTQAPLSRSIAEARSRAAWVVVAGSIAAAAVGLLAWRSSRAPKVADRPAAALVTAATAAPSLAPTTTTPTIAAEPIPEAGTNASGAPSATAVASGKVGVRTRPGVASSATGPAGRPGGVFGKAPF